MTRAFVVIGSFIIVLLALIAVVVSAQKAYPEDEQKYITLVGSPVNVQNFGIDLPVGAISAARTEQVDEEGYEEFLADDAQEEVTLADNTEEAELSDSESLLSSGASLKSTTTLNVRNGPCTNKKVIKVLKAGERVKFNGSVKTGCGHTWYGISGSFGSGYASKAYLTSASSSSPSKPSTPPKKPSGGGNTSKNGNSCKQSYNYPLFKQCDSRWGGNRLGSSSTICKVGCLMNSVTSALNGRGKTSKNPGEMNAWLKTHGGYYGNLFVWGAVSKFGFKYLGQTQNKASIRSWLCSGKVVILNVNGGGHWVLAKSYSNGVYGVNDSGYSRTTYTEGQVVRAAAFDA